MYTYQYTCAYVCLVKEALASLNYHCAASTVTIDALKNVKNVHYHALMYNSNTITKWTLKKNARII